MTTSGAATDVATRAYAFHAELLAHARRDLGRGADSAEDVVQEAYVHLLRRTQDGNPPHNERPWLHAVVASLCSRERLRRRRQTHEDMDLIPSAAGDPAELTQMQAEAHWALDQIAALPERERATLLADIAGLAQDGEGANARYQALHRARRKMRTLRAGAWAATVLPLALLRPFRALGAGLRGGAATNTSPLGVGVGTGIVKGLVVASTAVVGLAGGQLITTIDGTRAPAIRPPSLVAGPPSRPDARPARLLLSPSAGNPDRAHSLQAGPGNSPGRSSSRPAAAGERLVSPPAGASPPPVAAATPEEPSAVSPDVAPSPQRSAPEPVEVPEPVETPEPVEAPDG